MTLKATVALYSRISTNQQSDEVQIAELRQLCDRSGWVIFNTYRDAVSGTTRADERKALSLLLTDARKRSFNRVVVWSVCRLGRSMPNLIQTLSEFQAIGIEVYSYRQGIDTSTPMGQSLWAMLGIFAEFELSIRKERQMAGIARAKANGVRFGRKPRDNWLVKNKVLKLRAKGWGMNKIARELGIGSGVVFRVVKEHRGKSEIVSDV